MKKIAFAMLLSVAMMGCKQQVAERPQSVVGKWTLTQQCVGYYDESTAPSWIDAVPEQRVGLTFLEDGSLIKETIERVEKGSYILTKEALILMFNNGDKVVFTKLMELEDTVFSISYMVEDSGIARRFARVE
ncbi:MAG: hypothetical protein LBK47_06800 [Prevotellaceae bacterium]|jgi:hypothetical protein|nr:hypothetical protein [Prevotellaceae bacterium]